ncbi:MAG: VOC family protein [Gemmataceae bacterium]
MPVKPIPDGYHGATPYLTVKCGKEAMAFYAKAFGAEEVLTMPMPNGSIGHAEMKIGNAYFMLGEENPNWGNRGPKTLGGTPVGILVYTPNVDAFIDRAITAGAVVKKPLQDQFYGDRSATVEDPDGHQWTFATHIEDVSPAEMTKRMEKMMAGCGQS